MNTTGAIKNLKAKAAKLQQSKNSFYWLFGLGLLFFSIFYIDIWHTPNPISRALPVLTYHETNTLEISRYQEISLDKSKIGERYYSDKAPLPSLITIPFYQLSAALGQDKWDYNKKPFNGAPTWYKRLSYIIFLGSVLCSSMPFALLAFFAFQIGKQNFNWKPTLITLSVFGTYLFIYAGTYFNHLLSGLFLAFATYFIKQPKKVWLSGLFCAFAFLSEYTLGLFAALLPLFLLRKEEKWKLIFSFGLGFLPALIIYAWYNYSLSGNPLTFVFYYTDYETFSKGIKQNYGFGFPSLESVYGLLLSPYMGILWFFTPFAFFIAYWVKSGIKAHLTDPVLINSLALFALISAYFIWWGGYSWGPRYLIPMACILALQSAAVWRNRVFRSMGLIVLSVSFLLHFSAKSTVLFLIPDRLSKQGEASFPFTEVVVEAIKAGNYNSNNLFTWWFDLDPKYSAICFLILFFAWLLSVEKLYRAGFLKTAKVQT